LSGASDDALEEVPETLNFLNYRYATFLWPNLIASMKHWGILGLQEVKALLGSIPAKDINSSNLKFWTCFSFHLFKILYEEIISNNFSYIF
jgi:hypothetical protein